MHRLKFWSLKLGPAEMVLETFPLPVSHIVGQHECPSLQFLPDEKLASFLKAERGSNPGSTATGVEPVTHSTLSGGFTETLLPSFYRNLFLFHFIVPSFLVPLFRPLVHTRLHASTETPSCQSKHLPRQVVRIVTLVPPYI